MRYGELLGLVLLLADGDSAIVVVGAWVGMLVGLVTLLTYVIRMIARIQRMEQRVNTIWHFIRKRARQEAFDRFLIEDDDNGHKSEDDEEADDAS